MSSRHHNQHVLYVSSDASNEQLRVALNQMISDASNLIDKFEHRTFEANMVINRAGRHFGYGYIWVDDVRFANLLLGMNPDGSKRVEYRDDPDWNPPESEEIDIQLSSWADIVDRDICPKICIRLPPLITIPVLEPTAEQLIEDGKITKINFEFSPAFVEDVDPKYSQNILCAKDVPDWITEQHLKDRFRRYASDGDTKINRKFRGKLIQDTYPFISINERRIAFITFSPSNYDAQFALLMTRQLIFENGKKNTVLVFNRSYQSH